MVWELPSVSLLEHGVHRHKRWNEFSRVEIWIFISHLSVCPSLCCEYSFASFSLFIFAKTVILNIGWLNRLAKWHAKMYTHRHTHAHKYAHQYCASEIQHWPTYIQIGNSVCMGAKVCMYCVRICFFLFCSCFLSLASIFVFIRVRENKNEKRKMQIRTQCIYTSAPMHTVTNLNISVSRSLSRQRAV